MADYNIIDQRQLKHIDADQITDFFDDILYDLMIGDIDKIVVRTDKRKKSSITSFKYRDNKFVVIQTDCERTE